MIHYFTSDDLPGATAGYVDEDASWWVGVQKCGAQLALTTALALAASTAVLATQVFSFHQDDPLLTASYQDEHIWQNQVAPFVAPTIFPDPWLPDEQTPALTAGYLEEQTWQDPVQHVLSWSPPQLFIDDQVIVPQPSALIPDDSELWRNDVAPYVAPTIIPPTWAWDEQTPTLVGQMDEDFWVSGVAPIGGYPVPVVVVDDGNFTRAGIHSQIIWLT